MTGKLSLHRKKISEPRAIARSLRIGAGVERGLERLDDNKHDDRDQRQGRQLVDEPEEPRGMTILIDRKSFAPARKQQMKERQSNNKNEFSPNPTHPPIHHSRHTGE